MPAHDSPFAHQLEVAKEYFDRSTRCLDESHSAFRPDDETFTVAQHVAHVAQTVDWFMEGAFRPEGFSMDFEGLDAEVRKVTSLAEARRWLDRSFAGAVELVGSKSREEMMEELPPGPVMGGDPRVAIIGGITDHTAHHRGALTVYSRLQGLTPAMPYMEM